MAQQASIAQCRREFAASRIDIVMIDLGKCTALGKVIDGAGNLAVPRIEKTASRDDRVSDGAAGRPGS